LNFIQIFESNVQNVHHYSVNIIEIYFQSFLILKYNSLSSRYELELYLIYFDFHAGLIMRPRKFLLKCHWFNFEFICNNFGEHVSFMLKRWIDANYKLIRAVSQVLFLKHYKLNNLLLTHLLQILMNKFQLNHYSNLI